MKRLISVLTLYGFLMVPGKAIGQRIQVGEMTVPDKGQLRISMPGNNANVKNDSRIEDISYSYTSGNVGCSGIGGSIFRNTQQEHIRTFT